MEFLIQLLRMLINVTGLKNITNKIVIDIYLEYMYLCSLYKLEYYVIPEWIMGEGSEVWNEHFSQVIVSDETNMVSVYGWKLPMDAQSSKGVAPRVANVSLSVTR